MRQKTITDKKENNAQDTASRTQCGRIRRRRMQRWKGSCVVRCTQDPANRWKARTRCDPGKGRTKGKRYGWGNFAGDSSCFSSQNKMEQGSLYRESMCNDPRTVRVRRSQSGRRRAVGGVIGVGGCPCGMQSEAKRGSEKEQDARTHRSPHDAAADRSGLLAGGV
jgi:hypothetical protein